MVFKLLCIFRGQPPSFGQVAWEDVLRYSCFINAADAQGYIKKTERELEKAVKSNDVPEIAKCKKYLLIYDKKFDFYRPPIFLGGLLFFRKHHIIYIEKFLLVLY